MFNTTYYQTTSILYKNRKYSIPYYRRDGNQSTIMMLHGLGGAKENFWWATRHSALKNCTLIAFDNPGTGDATYYPDSPLNNDDLIEITALFIKEIIRGDFFLLGASMGGLTMLKYYEKYGNDNILGLISIEGNLTIQDCMFSSKVIAQRKEEFLSSGFIHGIAEMNKNTSVGYNIIADNIALNTDPTSYYHYSEQTVRYSETNELLEFFILVEIPKLFIHGDKNKSLSYISQLKKENVHVREISQSDHFLFYDNPMELYEVIGEFIDFVLNLEKTKKNPLSDSGPNSYRNV